MNVHPYDYENVVFNFTVSKSQLNIQSLGIKHLCGFNKLDSVKVDEDPNIPNYHTYLDKIGDMRAINQTNNEALKESFGVGIFKMYTIITGLEESDYVFLLMPS